MLGKGHTIGKILVAALAVLIGSSQAFAQTLSVGFLYSQDDPKGMLGQSTRSRTLQDALFTTLIKAKENGTGFGLKAATDVSIGAKSARFTLKEGLRFEDGTPIRAHDVTYSLARCSEGVKQNLQLLPNGTFELPFANYSESGGAFVASGDSSSTLRLLANCPLLPEDSQRFGDMLGLSSSLISSGFYKVIEQSKPNVIWLGRSLQRSGTVQKSAEKIMLQDYTEPEKMLLALRAGTLDAIYLNSQEIMQKVEHDETLRVSKCDGGMLVYRRGLSASCRPRIELEKWYYESAVQQ